MCRRLTVCRPPVAERRRPSGWLARNLRPFKAQAATFVARDRFLCTGRDRLAQVFDGAESGVLAMTASTAAPSLDADAASRSMRPAR